MKHTQFYTRWFNRAPVTSPLTILQQANLSSGTGWQVQTTVYSSDCISVGIDRKGFYTFREPAALEILTDAEYLRYFCDRLFMPIPDGECMQEYYRWLFDGCAQRPFGDWSEIIVTRILAYQRLNGVDHE